MTDEDLRFPTGRFSRPAGTLSSRERSQLIKRIAETPKGLHSALRGITNRDLDAQYRPGGWTVRQVVHHLSDSHMNAFIRIKLALTEPGPTVKPYDQDAWARLADSQGPIGPSLALFTALHERLVKLLESMTEDQFSRPVVHAVHGEITIDFLVALYAWHGQHHVRHVRLAREAAQRKKRG